MRKAGHAPERIVGKFGEVVVVLAKGGTVGQVCRQIGMTEQV